MPDPVRARFGIADVADQELDVGGEVGRPGRGLAMYLRQKVVEHAQ